MIKSMCFSGHRLNKIKSLIECQTSNFNKDVSNIEFKFFEIIKSIIYIKVNYYIDIGFRNFYIGMSDGIDLWVGDILLELKLTQYPDIQIVAVRPFQTHGSNFSSMDKKLYNKILELANNVICLDYEKSMGGYHRRNRYMVDNAESLLAFVCDYESGTGYTIEYAKDLNKSIEVINLLTISETFLNCYNQDKPFYKIWKYI